MDAPAEKQEMTPREALQILEGATGHPTLQLSRTDHLMVLAALDRLKREFSAPMETGDLLPLREEGAA